MTYLALTVGTSRGAETYGYTIVTLRDTSTGKRYRCMGGGYDMQGTVFAAWLEDTQWAGLQTIADRSHAAWDGQQRTSNDSPTSLYGMTHYTAHNVVRIDGACGLSSVERIAREIGLSVRHNVVKGRTVGFHVEQS